ncbi:MAG TPA: 50S ribosomal protein L15 [Candidatus Nanoperiomorbaceae bacterium]|jgi:large subunit ribosomal protein L15|nr:50S ribosomal protein L15 [Candidatus Nanoperiomorbaceae bacterium]HMQ96876.1 50S ribosomal protein L15 [Candidatus Nanoperiomorbaceae bacterium]HMR86479.1 50S ribosomal protein L15 [Candidatus Nanoperiomorbaceae bacterium]
MTKYHELNATANKDRKRVGRGISSGYGKTAGRGTKGQRARTGKKLGATFMGGQLPLVQGTPKLRGFKSKRVPAQVVYADQLNDLKGAKIDAFKLYEAGLIMTPYHLVKVIGRGELTSKATVELPGMSASVVAQLEKNGGTFVKTAVPLPPSSKTPEDKPEKADKK